MTATEELDVTREAGLAMGRYRLGARLGAGGFGTVFAARDERLERPVAVKVIPAGGPAPERAQREARAVARLDHDAIVGLFDAGEEDGCRYLVSELVEGRTLAQLEAAGELSDRDVLRIGLALADALAHAHERGVIHRDVKPQNVIVPDAPSSRRGAAKLTDFGVAHLGGEDALTRTGDVVGTLAYMAPEQASGRAVDEHADLYSLGLVLYEALAGENPVAAGSPTATARRIGTVLPPLGKRRGDLPAELCAAIDRAVAPNPEQRGELDDLFDALADALGDVSDDGGVIAPHPLERRLPVLPPAFGRLVAPAAAGALVWAALAGLTPEPAVPPALAAAVAAALVALLPRVGWLAAAVGLPLLLVLGPTQRPGAALLVAALAFAPPLLLRADGRAWALPAVAPAPRPRRPGRRVPRAGGPRGALGRARRARRAGRLVAGARRAVARACAGLRPRGGRPGPGELRRRPRDHRRRRHRAVRQLRRAAAGRDLGGRRARAPLARARALAVRRRRRRERLERRDRRHHDRAGRGARRRGGTGGAARPGAGRPRRRRAGRGARPRAPRARSRGAGRAHLTSDRPAFAGTGPAILVPHAIG